MACGEWAWGGCFLCSWQAGSQLEPWRHIWVTASGTPSVAPTPEVMHLIFCRDVFLPFLGGGFFS